MLSFKWDKNKEQKNIVKHRINFDEAKTVFYDKEALLKFDSEHSEDEERFILLGLSSLANVLIVCHCYRGQDEKIRIISARKATKNEEKQYYERTK